MSAVHADEGQVFDPSIAEKILDKFLGQADTMTEAALVLGNREADARSKISTAQTIENTQLATAAAITSHAALTSAASENLIRQMEEISPNIRAITANISEATERSTHDVAKYLAAVTPSMLQMGEDLATAHGNLALRLMSGEVSSDLSKMIQTSSAESAQTHGLFGGEEGGAARNLSYHDFGLVQEAMALKGAQLAGDNASLWSNHALEVLEMTEASTKAAQSHQDFVKGMTAEIDPTALYSSTFDALQKSNIVSAETAFKSTLDQYNASLGWGLQKWQIDQEVAAQKYSADLQYRSDIEAMRAQERIAREQSAATERTAALHAEATLAVARDTNATNLSIAQGQWNTALSLDRVRGGSVSSGVGSRGSTYTHLGGGMFTNMPKGV